MENMDNNIREPRIFKPMIHKNPRRLSGTTISKIMENKIQRSTQDVIGATATRATIHKSTLALEELRRIRNSQLAVTALTYPVGVAGATTVTQGLTRVVVGILSGADVPVVVFMGIASAAAIFCIAPTIAVAQNIIQDHEAASEAPKADFNRSCNQLARQIECADIAQRNIDGIVAAAHKSLGRPTLLQRLGAGFARTLG